MKRKIKPINWTVTFFMFVTAVSVGNMFVPAPAEAQYTQDCWVDKPPENINIDIRSAETTDYEILGSIEWQCGGSFPEAMTVYACAAFEPEDFDGVNGHWLWGRDHLNNSVVLVFNFLNQDPKHKGEIIGGRLADWGDMWKQNAGAVLGDGTGQFPYRAKFKLDFKGRVYPNEVVMPAGRYSGTVMPMVYFPRDASTGMAGDCRSFGSSKSLGAITVTVTIHPVCDVSTENIDFGSFSRLTRPQYAEGRIRVRCTALQPYSVRLTSLNGMEMKGSNGGTLPYELFKDSNHTNKWDVGIPQDYDSAIDGSELRIPVYARISPSGQRLKPGTYTDMLAVEITY